MFFYKHLDNCIYVSALVVLQSQRAALLLGLSLSPFVCLSVPVCDETCAATDVFFYLSHLFKLPLHFSVGE